MKNGLVIFFLLMLISQSCTNDGNQDGFINLKPGHFCQLASIAISGDTIFIAGSFIPAENPDIILQPIYSYLAAVGTDGKLIWEHVNDVPDYTRWTKVAVDNQRNVFAIGTARSPIDNLVAGLVQLSSQYGIEKNSIWVEDTLPHEMTDIQVTKKNQLAFLRVKELVGHGIPCINKQVELFTGNTDYHRDFCVDGAYSCTKFINDTLYFTAGGAPTITRYLYFINDADSLKLVEIPDNLLGLMVNDVVATNVNQYLMATTVKNEQGPCLYQLSTTDSFTVAACLNYWPMHGSTHLLPYGSCSILAFNAADETNTNKAQVVILNGQHKKVYDETVASTSNFIISDLVVNDTIIYLAGTLESSGDGSSMAVKMIPIPASIGCKVVN